MGRLLNPGLGELADRFTILQLKIFHGDPRNTTHFHAEQAQLLMRMEGMYANLLHGTQTAALIDQLRDVNKRLWTLEDQMAEYAKRTSPWTGEREAVGCANTAIQIWRANRTRNALIDDINKLAGNFQGAEKF